MDVHVVLRIRAAEVDAGEAGVQPRGETVADMADACLCLRGKKFVLKIPTVSRSAKQSALALSIVV